MLSGPPATLVGEPCPPRPPKPSPTTALDRLRTLTGDPGAEFRDGQLEAIRDVVIDRARVLCVQRTGWGKSAVYFVATALLREAGAGPTLIISPLLALMRNQLAAAGRLGLRAHTINSTNRDEWNDVRDRLAADTVDLLLISPERLNNARFREDMLPLFAGLGRAAGDRRGALHLRLGARLPPRLPPRQGHPRPARPGVAVLGTTATANDRVVGRRGLATSDRPMATSRCAPIAASWPARACASRCSISRGRPSDSLGSPRTFRKWPARGSSTR